MIKDEKKLFEEVPLGHPDTQGQDAELCPHLQIKNRGAQKKKNEGNFRSLKLIEHSNIKTENEDDSESEEDDMPRGGCPVMNNSKSLNPKMEMMKPDFE